LTISISLFALLGSPDSYISFIHIDDAAAAVVAALEAPAGTYNVAEPDPVRRSKHCDVLGEVVGRSDLRPMPSVVERSGGGGTASIARSHRTSSQRLQDMSTWSPTIHCVDRWKELR
jgi:NAD dependent epimerase/dehydratase family enzyme